MMAKGKTATVFFCQNCGYESSKWMGQCPGCREWNTLVEETISKSPYAGGAAAVEPHPLEDGGERCPRFYLRWPFGRKINFPPVWGNWIGYWAAVSYRAP